MTGLKINRKKILLTGGSGFIGKNILGSSLGKKYDIYAPSSRELNLIDQENVDSYFKKDRFDIIIHAAVKPSHRNAKDFSDLLYINTRMFFNLERHNAEYEKMLILGSGAIYDNRKYRPKMKEDEYNYSIPVDEHGYCKYICEKIIEKSGNIFDLRLFGIFGKYEDYAIRFISNAICKTLFDLPITIKQDRKFDYLYIDDLMPVLEWFIENNPEYRSYNITPDKSVSLYELALLVKRISGKDIPVLIAKEGMGSEYSGDNSRLKKEFKDIKFLSLEKSIADLYYWYINNINNLDMNLLLIDK